MATNQEPIDAQSTPCGITMVGRVIGEGEAVIRSN